MRRIRGSAMMAVLLAAVLAGCSARSPEISVSIVPDSAEVYVFYTLRLRAYLRNAPHNEVIWSVSGSGRCGTISDSGLYTAPPSVPSPAQVTVKATSIDDPSKSASAVITIVDGPDHPDQWTWVGGSNEIYASGSYGTRGVSDPSNSPPARSSALAWRDPSGALWLFGGTGYATILNDLWKYDPASDEWAWMSGSDRPDQIGVYGTKGTPDPSNMPGSREWSASWADAAGRLWLFGGEAYDADGDLGAINDLWKYDPGADEWTWMSGSDQCWETAIYGTKGVPDAANRPAGRAEHCAWIDPEGDFWVFGGSGFDNSPEQLFGHFNDLWTFDPDTLEWTWMAGTSLIDQPGAYGVKGVPDAANVPGGRTGAASWSDPEGDLWLFGGQGSNSKGGFSFLNDLWKYDRSLGQWVWISGSDLGDSYGTYGVIGTPSPSNVPGARSGAVAWTDSRGKLWLFGGYGFAASGYGRELNDLWQFDPSTLAWTWISGSDQTARPGVYIEPHIVEYPDGPGARYQAVSWLGPRGDLWLFGGYGHDAQSSGLLNDLWRYRPL